jgi:hypothetical protein
MIVYCVIIPNSVNDNTAVVIDGDFTCDHNVQNFDVVHATGLCNK